MQKQLTSNQSSSDLLTKESFKTEYCVDNGKLLKYSPNVDLINPDTYKIVYDEGTAYLK